MLKKPSCDVGAFPHGKRLFVRNGKELVWLRVALPPVTQQDLLVLVEQVPPP